MGVREVTRFRPPYHDCGNEPARFQAGSIDAYCSVYHYWSLHDGGANFVFADGSARFLTYQADPILPALSTIAGGEIVELP